MIVTSYSTFRLKMKSYLDQVMKNNESLYVTRSKGEDVVVMSKSDYNSILETFHLMKSPKNALRLLESMEQYNSGLAKVRTLTE